MYALRWPCLYFGCDISLHSRVEWMMPYDPDRHARRSIRLRDYDYAQPGAYFVTVCTYQRECLLGDVIVDGRTRVRLSEYGRIVRDAWFRSADIRPGAALDAFVIMPNHLHSIIVFHADVGAHSRAPSDGRYRTPRSLGAFIAGFKSATTARINERRGTPGLPVWQRNYYEHVLRNEEALTRAREYIALNPLRLHLDRENPHNR
jgi:putative transposase